MKQFNFRGSNQLFSDNQIGKNKKIHHKLPEIGEKNSLNYSLIGFKKNHFFSDNQIGENENSIINCLNLGEKNSFFF